MSSEWVGNNTNGVEFRRYDDGTIDEVVVYHQGEVVAHMEQMSDVCFWFGFTTGGHTVHVNVMSKNLRSHLKATGEDCG